jgi:hypothetical protein
MNKLKSKASVRDTDSQISEVRPDRIPIPGVPDFTEKCYVIISPYIEPADLGCSTLLSEAFVISDSPESILSVSCFNSDTTAPRSRPASAFSGLMAIARS